MSTDGGNLPPGIRLRRHTASEARTLRPTVQAVYVSSYGEAIASGHSFDSVEAFMSRFDIYAGIAGYDLVIAYHGDDAIGQTWGWPRAAGIDPDLAGQDGTIFVLSEIMVAREWTGRGIAHALHDTLLSARTEQRATLLVEPDNVAARRTYLRWGWRKVDELRPDWPDAPLFEVLTRELPLESVAVHPS